MRPDDTKSSQYTKPDGDSWRDLGIHLNISNVCLSVTDTVESLFTL